MILKNYLLLVLFITGVICMSCAEKIGFIVTKSNDTLNGRISKFLLSESNPSQKLVIKDKFMLPEYRAPQRLVVKVIQNKDTETVEANKIRNINFINKKGKDTTSYNVFENQLCKVFARKGDRSICKNYYVEDVSALLPYNNNEIIIRGYTSVILFIGDKRKILIYTNSEKRKVEVTGVLEFINNHYQKKFSTSDFKGEEGMFNYILNNKFPTGDSINKREPAEWQTLFTKENLKIRKKVWSPFENLPVLNNSNPDTMNFKAAYYMEKIVISSDEPNEDATIFKGPLNTSSLTKERIALQFINSRYHLNLSLENLNTYLIKKKSLEEQKKLFDFIINKESESKTESNEE